VGSRTLSRDSGLELSPATIRNIMADLEELGLVRSPHTSAGRVPTAQGYRLFINNLLTIQKLESSEVRKLRIHLDPDQKREKLMETTSNMLSELTHLAGIVTLPRQEHVTLRQVEFLLLSDRRVLAILVINEEEVQNRIIRTARDYTPAELQQASNYLTSTFAGKDLRTVREDLLRELRDTREHLDRMMTAVIEMAEKALVVEHAEDNLVVAGQTNLMSYDELADMEKLRHLFEVFNRKRDMLYLLDQSLNASGVQIFIGEESGYSVLDGCSVVTSTYEASGKVLGVLGVIGPTRMAYERIIPIVDLTAKLLGAALNPQH
jgi:heat-inducible transcriptional repressor